MQEGQCRQACSYKKVHRCMWLSINGYAWYFKPPILWRRVTRISLCWNCMQKGLIKNQAIFWHILSWRWWKTTNDRLPGAKKWPQSQCFTSSFIVIIFWVKREKETDKQTYRQTHVRLSSVFSFSFSLLIKKSLYPSRNRLCQSFSFYLGQCLYLVINKIFIKRQPHNNELFLSTKRYIVE